jgi:hypothetical protein
MINQAENNNPTLDKVLCVSLYEDNLDIRLSDKHQELQDKLKILDFMEKEKSNSPTLPLKLTRFASSNFKKPNIELPLVDIDYSQ